MSLDLFSHLALRPDIATGNLPQEQFAASLHDVIVGSGPAVYRDPALFFASSHPSTGMRQLLNSALGRLGGTNRSANSAIRLETSLGGGKTHSLIALYHAAHCTLPKALLADFVDDKNILDKPVDRIAAFIGDRMSGSSLSPVDGVTPKTLWGYLALQLGGPTAYALVKADDEARTAVGADIFEPIIGDQPTLIMLDEIARYLAVAKGVVVGAKTLADQTVAFIMALIAAVKAKKNAVLVLTTTETTDVFGDEVAELVGDIQSLYARDEQIIRPTGNADLAAILRRRLFETTPAAAVAGAVAAQYVAAAQAFTAADITLTSDASGPSWAGQIQSDYPFHPSVIEVLGNRLATIPDFQRTRGALRLVALALQYLWAHRPGASPALIHLHHLRLDNAMLVEDVTSRINRSEFKPVIDADIAASPGKPKSHAEKIDETLGTHDASHIATTVYFWSLTRDIPGVHDNALLTSVLEPGLDLPRYQRALELITSDPHAAAWYLTQDPTAGYRFGTEPSPSKVLQDFEDAVSHHDVTTTATTILEDVFKRSLGIRVQYLWQSSAIADNTTDCTLGIYHWDSFPGNKGVDPEQPLPSAIQTAWSTSPNGGPRLAQNRVLFLAPDEASHADMLRAVRTHIARNRLIGSTDHMKRFNDAQGADLKARAQAAALLAKVAVAAHMSVLIVPENGKLRTINLAPPSRENFGSNQTDRIIDQLKSDERVYVSGSRPPSTHLLKQKLGAFFDQPQTTADLLTKFATKTDLKIVLDADPILQAIRTGVSNGDWDYHDTVTDAWATREKPTGANIRIDGSTYIEPRGSAPSPVAAPCPFCHQVHAPGQIECVQGASPIPPVPSLPVAQVLVDSGAPAETLIKLLGRTAESGTLVKELRVALVETDKDKASMQLSQLASLALSGTKGLTIRYEIEGTVALAGSADHFQASFAGGAADFTQWARGAFTQAFQRPNNRDAVLKAAMLVTFDTPQSAGSAEINAIIKRARDTGPSHVTITITPEGIGQAV